MLAQVSRIVINERFDPLHANFASTTELRREIGRQSFDGRAVKQDTACRRQLTLGALTLFRGYRGDSQGHLRKAIEACTFSAKRFVIRISPRFG
jgi:hypothetical protein